MSFDLPNLTVFFTIFFSVAAIAVVVLVGALATFFAENRRVRMRRNEGVVHYYGHLVPGH